MSEIFPDSGEAIARIHDEGIAEAMAYASAPHEEEILQVRVEASKSKLHDTPIPGVYVLDKSMTATALAKKVEALREEADAASSAALNEVAS